MEKLTKFLNLVVQVLPQNLPEAIHQHLQLLKPKVPLAILARPQILDEFFETRVDLLVLRQQFELLPERRLLLGQDREEVALLDTMVHLKLAGELESRRQ